MAKIMLLLKQMLKEAYRFFMTMIALTLFLVMCYYVSKSGLQNDVDLFSVGGMGILSVFYAIMHPLVINRYLYSVTDANHMYSIPMTRFETFFSQYLLGLCIGLGMIISYSCLTTLVVQGQAVWLTNCNFLIVIFLFYYHLSLFCYWISGNRLFYLITLLLFIFGPVILYMVGEGIMQAYVIGYQNVNYSEILFLLIPIVKIAEFGMDGVNDSYYYLYLGFSVFVLVMTLVAVRYRPLEKTGDAIIFKPLSYLMRTVCCVLVSGVLLAIAITGNGYVRKRSILVSNLVISVVCVYCIEMLFAKKVNVTYSLKYAIPLFVMTTGFLYGGQQLLTTYIPKNYDANIIFVDSRSSFDSTLAFTPYATPEMMEIIQDVHHDILANIGQFDEGLSYSSCHRISLSYYNDGEEITSRTYYCSDETIKELLAPYIDSRELFDQLTICENNLIEQLTTQEKNMKITMDEQEWLINTAELRYRFSHYLSQVLDEEYAYIQETQDLSHLFCDNDMAIYFFFENAEDRFNYFARTERDFVYQALLKTFG